MTTGGYLNIQVRPTPQLWVAPPLVVPPAGPLTADSMDVTVDATTHTVDEN